MECGKFVNQCYSVIELGTCYQLDIPSGCSEAPALTIADAYFYLVDRT